MPGKVKHLSVENSHLSLAVSDGELNSSGPRGSSRSVNSLPGAQNAGCTARLPVARWAESFEMLLQDRVAIAYFTEFLKKEFSAENVYFWQACERFHQISATDTQQLAQEARRIYDNFLSSHSVSPVNIDRQAWVGEEMLAVPTPDMFRAQQLQIFNLMKFDSYARFVRSPLYQACLSAEKEGQPLPAWPAHAQHRSPPPDPGQKALVLDQDSVVLMDQEVKLENRVSFELEISPLSKTVRITAKSTKCLREALQPVLGKYGVDVEQALLRRQGDAGAVDLEKLVGTVAAQRLILEAATEGKATGACDTAQAPCPPQCKDPPLEAEAPASFARPRPPPPQSANRHTYDLEGLVELLNRAQSCQANDQRGLLSKEVLVLPDFLQLPRQDACPSEGCEQQPGS
ncbi:regulator of G-protein signaling 14 isoform X2 [Carettochelys insculpta]|uniref:regulator of G-protein signaling 14 isoform X2 n=1 Tax=Carettochelys insculpta TaxID=44489 RepID=UPI003EC02E09